MRESFLRSWSKDLKNCVSDRCRRLIPLAIVIPLPTARPQSADHRVTVTAAVEQ